MTKSELTDYIVNNEKLNNETLTALKNIAVEYPYFQTAHLLLAKNRYLIDQKKFEKYLPQTAAFCADRKKLFYLINSEKYAVFFKKEETEDVSDRTGTLLNSFLNNFSDEDDIIERNETNIISTDYLTYLESIEQASETESEETDSPELKHQDIIDSFLEKAETNEIMFSPVDSQTPKPADTDGETEDSGFLTETLARIYIKQKKYEQALAIIQQLSLNFPKKSAYFADQIRFLELLILNEKNKKQ